MSSRVKWKQQWYPLHRRVGVNDKWTDVWRAWYLKHSKHFVYIGFCHCISRSRSPAMCFPSSLYVFFSVWCFPLHCARNVIDIYWKLSWLYVCLFVFGLFECKQIWLHPQYLEWPLAHSKPTIDVYWVNEWMALIIICPRVLMWLNSICLPPTWNLPIGSSMRVSQKFSLAFSAVPGTLGVLNKYVLTECMNVYMEAGLTKNDRGSIERRGKEREKG